MAFLRENFVLRVTVPIRARLTVLLPFFHILATESEVLGLADHTMLLFMETRLMSPRWSFSKPMKSAGVGLHGTCKMTCRKFWRSGDRMTVLIQTRGKNSLL